MVQIVITVIVAFVFLACVLVLWMGIQLAAEKRLGFRKQGCKGPLRSEDGAATCCRGDGSPCKELGNGEAGESPAGTPH